MAVLALASVLIVIVVAGSTVKSDIKVHGSFNEINFPMPSATSRALNSTTRYSPVAGCVSPGLISFLYLKSVLATSIVPKKIFSFDSSVHGQWIRGISRNSYNALIHLV